MYYSIEELKTNSRLLVYLDSLLEWSKLNVLLGDKILCPYKGAYCYSVKENTFSSGSTRTNASAYGSGSIIITLNDIKENNMKKEIIGYKAPTSLFQNKFQKGQIYLKGPGEMYYPNTYSNFGESLYVHQLPGELVETWEPFYKESFKKDDFVVILCDATYNFGKSNGSDKPVTGKTYKVRGIDKYDYVKLHSDKGFIAIKEEGLRFATPEEIAKASETVYIMGIHTTNTFNLIVKEGKCFHKSEDITNYVKDVQSSYAGSICNRTFASYTFNVKDIIISKTGCENKETYLSQWLAIKL